MQIWGGSMIFIQAEGPLKSMKHI